MNIVITGSKVRFKAPLPGQRTLATEEHYAGRRITALIDGREQMFIFEKDELPFEATEEDMIHAIQTKLNPQG